MPYPHFTNQYTMKSIIAIIIIVFSYQVFAQENMNILWQGCYGGTEPDKAFGIVSSGNNYFVTGHTSSTDGDISFSHGSYEGWLIKVDSTGQLLWEKCYGGTNGDGLYGIHNIDNEFLYLVGAAGSSDGDISNDPYPESTDLWVIKADTSGNIIWDKIVGGNMIENYKSSIISENDDVIIICTTASDDGDISQSYGFYDIWVVNINSNGDINWDFTIGGSEGDYAGDIIQTSDGGYVVVGTSNSEDGNVNCVTEFYHEGIVMKLDSQRNIEWVQCYGGSWDESIFAVTEAQNGYVFSAYSYSNDGDVSGHHGIAGPPSDGGTPDIWVVKIDFEGNIIWQNSIGGSENEVSWYITQTEDEGFIVIGKTKSHDGDVVGNHSVGVNEDIWMVKLNLLGEIEWQRCIGGAGDEEVERGILKKGDYHYVIAGETGVMDGDVLCDPWGHDMWPDYWVFEIKDTLSDNGIEHFTTDGIKVYPNPAQNYLIFEFKANHIYNSIQLLNIFGDIVLSKQIKNNKTVFDTRNIQSGIYFFKILDNGSQYSGKVLIQK